MRKEFELTDGQLEGLYEACKPTVAIFGANWHAPTPQENANAYWKKLGKEMGFDYLTVEPVVSKGDRFFTAEVTEETPK